MITGLIIYDVTDKRIYRKMYKILDTYNVKRMQKSVYEINESRERALRLFQSLHAIINEETDTLAFIPLCEADLERLTQLGKKVSHQADISSYVIL